MQRYIFILFILLAFVSNLQAAEMRSWVGSNGKTIEAEFVSFDGKVVKLKNASGKELNVLLSLFSKEDQNFVKNGGKENTDNPFGEESTSIPKRSEFKPLKIDKQAEYLAIIKELEKALKETKQLRVMVVIYCHLASVQAMAGQTEAAKKSIEKAKELKENIVEEGDVSILNKNNYIAIAEGYLNKNEVKHTPAKAAMFADVQQQIIEGKIDDAKKNLEKTLSLLGKDYNNIDANISIIVLYVAMGDEETAEQVCKLTSGLIEQNPDLHKRVMDWERLARYQQLLITNTNIGKQLIDRCITIATSGSIEDKFETNRILRFVAEGQDWLGDEKSSLENYDLAEKDAHKVQNVKQRDGAVIPKTLEKYRF